MKLSNENIEKIVSKILKKLLTKEIKSGKIAKLSQDSMCAHSSAG